jgi:hypothetical protein
MQMKMRDGNAAVVLACAFALLSLHAEAADRVRDGQWVGTWTGAGRTRPTSDCMTRSDADAINGDVNSIRSYLEKTVPPAICKPTSINANGGQVVYTAICNGARARVITTNYHGDSFESVDSEGGRSEAKRVGAC